MITIAQFTELLAAFPLLTRLRLGPEEFFAISHQDFIRGEQRGGKRIFRLRFRLAGRQCVRYVSPRHAAALEAELKVLQGRVRARRHLNRVAALARKALRRRRSVRASLLEARG